MYCPYCGDEDLRPHEGGGPEGQGGGKGAPGAWECRSCTRVFAVKFVGLLARRGVSEGVAR
jgi:transposase-like protein